MRKFPASWVKALFTVCFLAFLGVASAFAQDTKDINARSPNPRAMSRKEKQAQKEKVKKKKMADKAVAKGIKQHEKLQTRDVRKRMKKSKRTASLNRAHKKEFFLKRWFQGGQRKKSR